MKLLASMAVSVETARSALLKLVLTMLVSVVLLMMAVAAYCHAVAALVAVVFRELARVQSPAKKLAGNAAMAMRTGVIPGVIVVLVLLGCVMRFLIGVSVLLGRVLIFLVSVVFLMMAVVAKLSVAVLLESAV